VHNKLLTPDQLEEALREQGQRGGNENLGEILVAKGFLTPRQLDALVRAQGELVQRERARRAAELGAATAPESEPPTEAAPHEAVADAGAPAATEPAKPAARAVAAEPVPASPSSAGEDAGSAELLALLQDAVARGASDVHVHAGAPIRLRIHGSLQPPAGPPLDAGAAERLAVAALDPQQRAELAEQGEVDLCFALPGVGRFRTNVYRQQRGLDVVFHCIPLEPPDLDDLGLPASLARFTTYHQGMVLVTGPAGCG
jgi:twitching motility protein PilT